MQNGVASHHVDYRAGRTTDYLPDGATADFSFELPHSGIADAFNGDAVRAAILGAQLSQQAGCVGYTVWMIGHHVTYLGRRGETHIEHFPS